MFTFLQLNGFEPTATEIDYYQAMMAVASGRIYLAYHLLTLHE